MFSIGILVTLFACCIALLFPVKITLTVFTLGATLVIVGALVEEFKYRRRTR